MEGIFVNSSDTGNPEAGLDAMRLRLLAKRDDIEIMVQTVLPNAVFWVTPAEDPETLEFFFIFDGSVELTVEGETKVLLPGDSFYVNGLKEDILLKTEQETRILYVTNRPVFDSLFGFHDDLTRLLMRINDKDHYTFNHSKNVLRYSIKLYELLKDQCSGVSMDDMAVAALFHDVGKCFVPDEILKKNDKLLPGEYRYIMRHPLDSARLLRPHFGERIAEIAQNHHERLDGSGYPMGITADEISFEAKIVTVADVFDAMISDRGYNHVKTPLEAAKELCEQTHLFDERVTSALLTLVTSNALDCVGGAQE
jgi:HD-GYP domain-containing protein (c-di-GMP phosphodiesterase class II)